MQSVESPIADPGFLSLISAGFHTFMVIIHKIKFMVILLLPLIRKGLLSVTSNSMLTVCVREVLGSNPG